jgi:hypothetical protein
MPKNAPGDADVLFLHGDLSSALCGGHGALDALTELGRANKKDVLLLIAGHEHVVFVLAFFLATVLHVTKK